MKLLVPAAIMAIISGIAIISCQQPKEKTAETNEHGTDSTSGPVIHSEDIHYNVNGVPSTGFMAYDSASDKKRPVVIVVPEWWGLTQYPRTRALKLAELGYLAVVADIYGNATIAQNPAEAEKLAMPFYKDPNLAKQNLETLIASVHNNPLADTNQVAVIGYCFGGSMALNFARMGEPVKGVVSFHGGLKGVAPQKGMPAAVLICHGEADKFVSNEEVAMFKKQMDSAAVTYTFKSYPNATHAFTNPDATENGKKFSMPIEYNPAADSASWEDMKTFFSSIFH